jgi:hypothetical protein
MSFLALYSTKSDLKSEDNNNITSCQDDSSILANSQSEISICNNLN